MTTDPTVILLASLVWLALALALYVWTSLALAAVFRKSGVEAWRGWVPILNQIVLLRLGGLSPWLVLLNLVPVAGWIALVVACHSINRSYGFGGGMTLLAALLLPVWATVLGFGSARWVGVEHGPRRTARFDDEADVEIDETSGPPVRVVPAWTGGGPGAPAPAVPAGTPYAPVLPPPAHGAAPVAPPAPVVPPILPPPGGWTPAPVSSAPSAPPAPPAPAAPPAPVRSWRLAASPEDEHDEQSRPGFASYDADDEVTGAVVGAPAPISAVRSSPPAAVAAAPVPPLMRTRATPDPAPVARADAAPPDAEPWAPRARSESDAFGDSSPVSAVVEVPGIGGPLSARSSVSAQNRRPQIPDDPFEATIIARRRRTEWSIVPPSGEPIPLGADVALLGRRPAADPDYPSAQLIAIEDGTVSKTHARLEQRGDVWFITDLGSTNGVAFATVLGTEVEAVPGEATEAGDRFLLGDAEIRLVRTEQ